MSVRKTDAAPKNTITDTIDEKKDDGLAASILLGYALNDGAAGGLMGGNLLGGMIGDAYAN
jgi:hypothetical protein